MVLSMLNYEQPPRHRGRFLPHTMLVCAASLYLGMVLFAWMDPKSDIAVAALLTIFFPAAMIIPIVLIYLFFKPRPFHILALCGYVILVVIGAEASGQLLAAIAASC
jgi:hypothetical protein